MRIIAGKAKGFKLQAPKGDRVRPTPDRVREALFSILAPRLPGARFLDLFAGTGANGIEALSRGAAHCTFADNSGDSLANIRQNIEAAGFAPCARVSRLELPGKLHLIAGADSMYDVIFADPPYDFGHYRELLEQIDACRLLGPGGVIIIEHPSRLSLDERIGAFFQTRRAVYGNTCLSFFS